MSKIHLILPAIAMFSFTTASASLNCPTLGNGDVQEMLLKGTWKDDQGRTWKKIGEPQVFNEDGSPLGYFPKEALQNIVLAAPGGKHENSISDKSGSCFFQARIAKGYSDADPVYWDKIIRVEAKLAN